VNLTLHNGAGKGARHAAPPCTRLGAQCRRLNVTLRIGSLEEGKTSLDHEATWLLGHTQHVAFGEVWDSEGELYVEAVLHVPCRFLKAQGPAGRQGHCTAHGFEGPMPRNRSTGEQPRRVGDDRFRVVDDMRLVERRLAPPPRSLPVMETGENPCASAPCQTADHRRGSACCRDLQIEIMCDRSNTWLEALVRSRRVPYLCKVARPGDFSIEAEIISACDFLDDAGAACTLHGRQRADGRSAKPDLCSDWPPKGQGLHPGCVFGPKRRRKRSR
jgi:hypothetical protein